MRKFLSLLLLFGFYQAAIPQQRTKTFARPGEKSIVKDSLGTEYPYAVWSRLFMTGRYDFWPEQPGNEASAFIMTRLSEEEYEKKMSSLPRPTESKYFRTGAKFSPFKTTAFDGSKIDTKELKGKIIVLNFWFINCSPCRIELPELHALRETYRNDNSVVFIAVALDHREKLQEFLQHTAFSYQVVPDGIYIANQYKINAFPTNVVINQEGKVYFHSSGLSHNTIYWINRSIRELKSPQKPELFSCDVQKKKTILGKWKAVDAGGMEMSEEERKGIIESYQMEFRAGGTMFVLQGDTNFKVKYTYSKEDCLLTMDKEDGLDAQQFRTVWEGDRLRLIHVEGFVVLQKL